MTPGLLSGLSERQLRAVESWLPSPALVSDLSWGQVDTLVLHVRSAERDFVVKAGGPANHHIGREISAHESFTAQLVACGAASRLVGADREVNVLVVEYLEGSLVEGTPTELEPDVHEQAGRLLRAFHASASRADPDFERAATAKAIAWLDAEHRVALSVERRARELLAAYRPQPVTSVPTHGDWQPRNWLVQAGRVKVIDFGRFAFRPAETDLCRLAAQQWRGAAELEAAFLKGYGSDPRDPERWPVTTLREAVGTAVWAYQVGDEAFEAQGHRMLDEALAAF